MSLPRRRPGRLSDGSSKAGSMTVVEADDTIVSRLESLSALRERMEELATRHRLEEEDLRETMSLLLRQTSDQREKVQTLEEQIGAYEAMLSNEEREKSRAVEMVAAFKAEGGHIVTRLKASLKDATNSCEEEKEKRTRLEREVEQKLEAYRGLLEEQERVVSQLREKNARLEMKLKKAEQLVRDISTADGFNHDYRGMLLELKGTDKNLEEAVPKTNDTASISSGHTVDGSVQHKLRLQDQIIQMLYAKLKAEQTHRLETEEQAASMVAAEEDTIRKLEDKLREAEERDTNNSMARMTPRSSATPSSAIVHASTPVLNTHRTRLASPSPPQKAYTLESQLAEVTRDFNQSLEMWTRKLNTPPASARRASHLGDPATHGTAREAAPVGLPTSMAAEADQHQSFSSADASLLPADDGDFFPDTPAVKRQARFEASPYHDDFLPDSPTPSSRLPLSEL